MPSQSRVSEHKGTSTPRRSRAISCSLIKTHLGSQWEAPAQPLPEDADLQKTSSRGTHTRDTLAIVSFLSSRLPSVIPM